jgi:hypothetical protein
MSPAIRERLLGALTPCHLLLGYERHAGGGVPARATRAGALRGARYAWVGDCAPLRHVGLLRRAGAACSHGVRFPRRRGRQGRKDRRKTRRRVQGQIRTSTRASGTALFLVSQIVLSWRDLCMPPNGHQLGPARLQRNAQIRPCPSRHVRERCAEKASGGVEVGSIRAYMAG